MTNAFIDTLKSDVERKNRERKKEGRKEKKRKMPGTFNEAKC